MDNGFAFAEKNAMCKQTQLLKLAINKLSKFHAPKLHKVAPKVELSSDDRSFKQGWRDHHRSTNRTSTNERASEQLLCSFGECR